MRAFRLQARFFLGRTDMPNPAFRGVYPILATPFLENEELDEDSLRRTLAFMAKIGVEGVTVLGVLGEANRMSDRERERVVRIAVDEAAGRMSVIAGISHPGTRATIELGSMARAQGADAVMVTPSAEPVPNEARIGEYFSRVCEAVDLPVVLQDHPASTGVHMSVDLIARIVAANPNVRCIKAEAVPSAPKIAALSAAMSATLDTPLPMLSGLGGLYGQFDLERGSSGYNTGFAFPEVLQAQLAAWQRGELALARRIWQHFLPLIVFEQQPGVGVRKALLRRRGLLASARVRHPGAQAALVSLEQLDELLEYLMPDIDLTQPLDVEAAMAAGKGAAVADHTGRQ
jgi:4-hydroxy-tetrahydrodipicolinate synthase